AHRDAAHASAGDARAGGDALHAAVDRRVRGDRGGAGGRGIVRGPLDRGAAADRGDRREDGARRGGGGDFQAERGAGVEAERARGVGRAGGGVWTDATDEGDIDRDAADRSADVRRDGRAVFGDRGDGIVAAGAESGGAGTDSRVA